MYYKHYNEHVNDACRLGLSHLPDYPPYVPFAALQVAAMLLKGRRSTDTACTPSNRISGGGRKLPQASNLRGLALGGPTTEGPCTAPAGTTGSRMLADAGIAGTATGGGGNAGNKAVVVAGAALVAVWAAAGCSIGRPLASRPSTAQPPECQHALPSE